MASGKRIADAVHGTIDLSPLEGAIISTRAYQRLRGVKHLGLASLVFPGADYSRFAHGVGTNHVTGLILNNLSTNAPGSLEEEEIVLYRVAALLHDIGHYPFSHTFERALKNYYSATQLLKPIGAPEASADGEASDGNAPEGNWLHEELGAHVITEDDELASLLTSAGIDLASLTGTIARSEPPKYANLISSDLDADRIDYLMRTAIHTGLPYGNVDLPYLLSQIRIDNGDKICFTSKGMRAAEHLLLSRYFDYQQVSYHKTVAGLEEVLNDAIACLLRRGALSCRPSDLTRMIEDHRWYHFDDGLVTSLMREALDSADAGEETLFNSILQRKPPKLVADREVLGSPATHAAPFKSLEKMARARLQSWRDEFGCPFYVWDKQGLGLTKIGSRIPVPPDAAGIEEETYDKVQQAVHILTQDGASIPIQHHIRSLVYVLSEHALYSLRVYALLPPERESERGAVEARVNADLGDFYRPQ